MFLASTNVNLTSGVHLSTIYLLVAIIAASVTLYFAIKKNRQDNKAQQTDAITDRVVAESRADIAEAVAQQVKEAISTIDYKISRNGKNTNNIGDVAARTEEKVDGLIATVNVLAINVKENGDQITRHLGWHSGFLEAEEGKKKRK